MSESKQPHPPLVAGLLYHADELPDQVQVTIPAAGSGEPVKFDAPAPIRNACLYCGQESLPGRGPHPKLCSAECCWDFTHFRGERIILDAIGEDRCQWCHCKIYKSYHEPTCGVRDVDRRRQQERDAIAGTPPTPEERLELIRTMLANARMARAGFRNTYARSLANVGRQIEIPADRFWPLFQEWNLRNDPPLTESELKSVMDSAYASAP